MKTKFKIRGEKHFAEEHNNNNITLDGEATPLTGNGTWQRLIEEVVDFAFPWLDESERAMVIEGATDE